MSGVGAAFPAKGLASAKGWGSVSDEGSRRTWDREVLRPLHAELQRPFWRLQLLTCMRQQATRVLGKA